MRDELERWGRGAPRLRLVALVAVGLVVLALVAVALVGPNRSDTGSTFATGHTKPDGRLCVNQDDRLWTSVESVVPAGETLTIEGRWAATGAQRAQLTTSTGRTIDLHTDQAEGEVQRPVVSCAIFSA